MATTNWQLAQLNIATMVAPLEDARLADFRANLDLVNALGDASEGFVWRMKGEGGNAVDLRPLGDDCLINVTIWRDLDALKNYIYGEEHLAMMRRKREWFKPAVAPQVVLWWVAEGHRPDVPEACQKLAQFTEQGATPDAFSIRQPFPPPGTREGH